MHSRSLLNKIPSMFFSYRLISNITNCLFNQGLSTNILDEILVFSIRAAFPSTLLYLLLTPVLPFVDQHHDALRYAAVSITLL